ncbi:MAG: VWA domain-containing protein [Acidilobaceae archaeon]
MVYGKDYSIALDISLSMGEKYSDMIPSKLEACKEAIAILASRVLQSGSRIAITLFHEKPIPLLPLTGDYKLVVRAISDVNFTGEGSALGDGIVEAIKILRGSRRDKIVIALTDGGVTEGIPVKASALYAKYSGVKLAIIVLSRDIRSEILDEFKQVSDSGAEILFVESKQKLISAIMKMV